jgi:hypothetical protein
LLCASKEKSNNHEPSDYVQFNTPQLHAGINCIHFPYYLNQWRPWDAGGFAGTAAASSTGVGGQETEIGYFKGGKDDILPSSLSRTSNNNSGGGGELSI